MTTIISNTEEVSLTNTAPTTGGARSNVQSLRHTNLNGSAATRFLRQSDGAEVGASGYQNGAPGNTFYLNGYVYLAGSMPYDSVSSAFIGTTPPPTGIILGQEGFYNGGAKTAARLRIDPDWSISICDPTGATILRVDPLGFVDYVPVAVAPPAPPSGRLRLYAEAVAGGGIRLAVVFPSGDRQVVAEQA